MNAFGPAVRFCIPLNQPLVFLLAGFFDGQIPPGVADAGLLPRVFDHLMARTAPPPQSSARSIPQQPSAPRTT